MGTCGTYGAQLNVLNKLLMDKFDSFENAEIRKNSSNYECVSCIWAHTNASNRVTITHNGRPHDWDYIVIFRFFFALQLMSSR